jgi:hypothetical protein
MRVRIAAHPPMNYLFTSHSSFLIITRKDKPDLKGQRGESPHPQSVWELADWEAYFGTTMVSVNPIPEPTPCALLVMMLLGTAMIRWV